MTSSDIELISCENKTIYGVCSEANDRTISKDIPRLSARYHAVTGTADAEVLPFYILSSGYDETTRDFRLFVGGETAHEGLEALELPAGEYARITVRPKLGFAWGLAVGEAKRFFYTQWLPQSGYRALNMEYELHTERSIARRPTVDVIFAIEAK